MCTNSCLVKYFAFISQTEAAINIIFINLEFSEKGLCLPFLEKNSHSHTCGSNKAIGILDIVARLGVQFLLNVIFFSVVFFKFA